MSDVTVIGLGAMGSAIANALIAGGHDVTVWNRSPDRMLPFAKIAASCAGSAREAVTAGHLIVESMPSDTEEIQHLGEVLKTGNFGNPGASIGVYSGVLDRILEQARDASINAEIAEFADRFYKQGMAAGLEQEEVVALIKLLRKQQ